MKIPIPVPPAVLSALAIALAACDGGDGGPDASSGCPSFSDWETGDDGASDLSLPPDGGRAVAGRIGRPEDLPGGEWPRGRVGDFLLANDRVAFVIEDARASDGYGTAGGELLDADLVGPGGPSGATALNEVVIGLGLELIEPSSVGVVADGSDGAAAIVRAVGTLAPVGLLESCCSWMYATALGMPAAIDYLLEPDAQAVEVRLTVRNDTETGYPLQDVAMLLIGGDGLRRYAPAAGFDLDAQVSIAPWVGLVGERISYAWIPAERDLRPLLTYEGVSIYSSAGLELGGCAESVETLGHLVVAGGDLAILQSAVRDFDGDGALPEVTGRVVEASGEPASGVRVHAVAADGTYASMARTGSDGRYALWLEPGTYELTPWQDDRRPPESVAVSVDAEGAEADFTLGPVGVLRWTVTDGDGELIPAKVIAVPLDEPAPVAPAAFGEPSHPFGAMLHTFGLPRSTEVLLPVGRYEVTASRGFEHEIDVVEVEVTEDPATDVDLVLERVVDTDGWQSADFHVHARPSADSNDPVEWKAMAAAAEGVELPVSTEHDWVSDLEQAVLDLGLEGFEQSFAGQEITTFVYGHFCAFVLEPRADERNRGAIEWMGIDPPDLFQSVRDIAPGAVLQVNHPRGSASGAYFSYLDLDPQTLEVAKPEALSLDFDAVEVFNGSSWVEDRDDSVLDWFGLLSHGHRVCATGNSDSHTAEWSEVGYPRNYLDLGTDDPREVDPSMIEQAVRSGRVVVSGGVFVTVEAEDGEGPGEVAPAPGGLANLRVVVQAPSWVEVEQLEIIVDGEALERFTLDESTRDPENPAVRFDRQIDVEAGSDAWVVAAAWSDRGSLTPVVRDELPFGVTNALFLDVDGNGEFDPE